MKRFLLIAILASFSVISSYGQFSVGFTNTGNLISFKLKPVTTVTTGFSTIEFFVIYPNPGSPAFTYGAVTANAIDFPGMTATGTLGSGSWEIDHNNPAFLIPNYNVDHIFYTAPAPATTPMTYNANQEYNLISIPLTGAGTVNMEVVHQDTEANFYLAITSETGGDLRAGANHLDFANYFYPTTSFFPGPTGSNSTIYFSAVTAPLPVKFVGFDISKIKNSAVLNWRVENEDDNTKGYEILTSLNGVDFTTMATLPALNNGRSNNSYSFTKDNLSALRSSGVIYFRIKQVDKDGRPVFTEIKNVRLDSKGIALEVYPNPIKSVANLSFDLLQTEKVSIIITDGTGKLVKNMQVQGFKGSNIKSVNLSNLSSGNYMLKLQTAGEVSTMPLVKAN